MLMNCVKRDVNFSRENYYYVNLDGDFILPMLFKFLCGLTGFVNVTLNVDIILRHFVTVVVFCSFEFVKFREFYQAVKMCKNSFKTMKNWKITNFY